MNFRSGENLRWMSRGSFCDLFGIFQFIQVWLCNEEHGRWIANFAL